MDHALYSIVTENDALPLEYKLEEGRPGRYLDVNDIINNPSCFGVITALPYRVVRGPLLFQRK